MTQAEQLVERIVRARQRMYAWEKAVSRNNTRQNEIEKEMQSLKAEHPELFEKAKAARLEFDNAVWVYSRSPWAEIQAKPLESPPSAAVEAAL